MELWSGGGCLGTDWAVSGGDELSLTEAKQTLAPITGGWCPGNSCTDDVPSPGRPQTGVWLVPQSLDGGSVERPRGEMEGAPDTPVVLSVWPGKRPAIVPHKLDLLGRPKFS